MTSKRANEERWSLDENALRGRVAVVSESPRYVGRAVAALAADEARARFNQRSLTSGQLAAEYRFTDLDGSRPDVWRYMQDSEDAQCPLDHADYR